MPAAAKLTSRDEPPALMNGSVMPVIGSSTTTTRAYDGRPSRSRAASRSIAVTSRIGVPVGKHGRRVASVAQVASNETAMAEASRAVARTLLPGMTLPSQSRAGMPSRRAAMRTGMAT